MSWTDEKVNKLKELWGKGNTASQIAEIIGGISRNAVIGKAHRLNLSAKIKTKSSVLREKEHLKVIYDQRGVPTSPSLISEVLKILINSYKTNAKWDFGIYHLTPRGEASWFIIAKLIISLMNEIDTKNSISKLTPLSISQIN